MIDKLEQAGSARGAGAVSAEGRPPYDIDETIRVVHEIDEAVAHADSLEDWLATVSRQDYRDVAPDVLAARADMLRVLRDLYARQVAVEDQQALWKVSSGMLLLGTLSVVDAQGGAGALGPEASVDVDREQAKRLLDRLLDQQAERARLVADLRRSEDALIGAMMEHAQVYWKYLDEWDRLCALRDRAYLAAWNGDWDAALDSARAAIAAAPLEREAHLIAALALIESGRADDPEGAGEVDRLLAEVIDEHPDQTAPALLLRGVLRARRGDREGARLDLRQAAAYYPRQADRLADMLDPYRARSFLRRSHEGTWILQLYKATMLGAGYFSPDLQLARLAFEEGDVEAGRRKVADHFARRRAQGQWDYLISDLAFCEDLLGDDYRSIFPEDVYLDLVAKPALVGSSLKLAVRNRSDRALHNATLVLAVQFTDMHPADYETFVGGRTQPAVNALDTTDFGTTEVRFDLYGRERTVDDIVKLRAILVSDEAVVWVDTDAYKLAEAEQMRQRRREREPGRPVAARGSGGGALADRVAREAVDAAKREAVFQVDVRKLLKDDVVIRLPRELVLLRPLFRLRNAATGDLLQPDENLVVGDHIELRFSGVGDFGDGESGTFDLVADTPAGELVLSWDRDADGSFRLDGVRLGG